MPRRIAAGNWKMNGTGNDLAELTALMNAHPAPDVEVLVCLPATLICRAAALTENHPIAIGAQDCHVASAGAHTGDVSAAMLAEAGAIAVILGHSERRADHGETDTQVRAKVKAAHAAGLTAIICVGESLDQREAGTALDTVNAQLSASLPREATATDTIIAYEPIWAIGTGNVPTSNQIAEMHCMIRSYVSEHLNETEGAAMTLLYGGSVKAGNAAEVFATPDVDGALVGGASLTASDFSPIIRALETVESVPAKT